MNPASWLLVVIAVCVAVATGCAAGTDVVAAPEPTATATATATPTATPSATAAPVPTATLESTATPTPTPVEPLAFVEVNKADCPIDVAARGVTCQSVRLPSDSTDPTNGASVELLLASVDGNDESADESPPVVFIQGGPGGGGTASARYFTNQPLDIIFVDLRGTGGSSPSLDCPELDAAYPTFASLPSRSDEFKARYLDAEQRCRDRLVAAGINLDDFDTAQYATDLELVRQALGYERWSLWGVSYGTRVALEVARLYPDGIHGLVIDSVLPAPVDFFAGISASAQGSIARVVDGCAGDDACAERYGDLDELIGRTAAALDADPVTVQTRRPESDEPIDVLVDGPRFYDMLFGQLYRWTMIGRLPLLVERASRRDLTELVDRTLADADPEVQGLAEAVYFSTWCQDEVPFHAPDADEAVFADESAAFRVAFEYPMDEHCAVWNLAASEPVVDTAVRSGVPALVFAGGFDPITPPSYARQAAATLTNSTTVVLAKHAHGMFTACPAAIMQTFLAAPAEPPDTSCADEENTIPMVWQ